MCKVKVAIIGCGAISRFRHIPEYIQNKNVEIIAYCDTTIERAEAYALEYGGRFYKDYKEMIDSEPSLQAVSVCTPNSTHAEMTIYALNRGIHVLCEKPMAATVKEAQQMIEAAKSNNRILMIGHNQRLMAPHVKVKELLVNGNLGKVLTFRTTFGHPGPETWSVDGKESWFFRKEEAVMGALGDLGVHKVDLIRWLLEEEIIEVSAMIDTLDKTFSNVEDHANCLYKTESGVTGTMVASWIFKKGEDNSTILYCENGTIEVGTHQEYQVIVRLINGEIQKYQVGAIATNDKGGQRDSRVIEEFIKSILNNMSPLITGEEGMKSLNVILHSIKAANEKRTVSILSPSNVTSK
ncbi:Gfo/Idh/MocA family protein [Metabacillus iocasae]|uniref:Dehydrogenase n=1 Tax=Priestia iocasae TaxID=2291674 RepID=A0ABS2QX28_9BACI|nr:Gfo/Idh/MocA family oxidoreductase [Metabacillus iocasae]MBM7703552.1 putative dehydrogenase [Metabacillus iocasae]